MYVLVQDEDCHWYVIPKDKIDHWIEWCEIDPDDERAWEVPDYADPTGGDATFVVFDNYTIEQDLIMKWLKNKITKWLGIEEDRINISCNRGDIIELRKEMRFMKDVYSNLVNIGVDVHFREPSMILVYSKLNGGQLRHIPAKFENLKELNDFVQLVKAEYNAKDVIFDAPPSARMILDNDRKRGLRYD